MRGLPTKKWPGVRTSNPSSGKVFKGHNGRLLRIDSTSTRTDQYSSTVKLCEPRSFFSSDFVDLTAASHNPPKCGARPGENFQVMRLDVKYSQISCLLS